MERDFVQIYDEFIVRVQAIQQNIRRDQAEGVIDSRELRIYAVSTSNDDLPPDSEKGNSSTERILVAAALASIPPANSTDSRPDTSTKEVPHEPVALYWSTEVLEPIRNLVQAVQSTFYPDDEDFEDFYSFARTQLRGAPGSETSDERQAARILMLAVAAAIPPET